MPSTVRLSKGWTNERHQDTMENSCSLFIAASTYKERDSRIMHPEGFQKAG